MKCALCKLNEADKSNTHCLTDAIIRSCLNQDGSQIREKGLYVDLSTTQSYVDFNFQRETSVEEIEKSLGREPNDEEIEKAKEVPFSRDGVFCSKCENIFTEIETRFIKKILPVFREANHYSRESREVEDTWGIRMFFYLQVWRYDICYDTFMLPDQVSDKLRQCILSYKDEMEDCKIIYPIRIDYLVTEGGEEEYTSNFVGAIPKSNPYVIIMNDFVIQFYETNGKLEYCELYGLNEVDNYKEFINVDSSSFKVKINVDNSRKRFNSKVMKEKVLVEVESYVSEFKKVWKETHGGVPEPSIVKEFLIEIASDFPIGVKYSSERIESLILKHVQR